MVGSIDFDLNVHNVAISFKFKISVYLGPNKRNPKKRETHTSQCVSFEVYESYGPT
jgi:hypothetical protein